jgi:hypothetical protein
MKRRKIITEEVIHNFEQLVLEMKNDKKYFKDLCKKETDILKKCILCKRYLNSQASSPILESYIKTKFNIISYDNYSTGTIHNHIASKRVKYIKGNSENIEKKINKYKNNIHTLFHFAEFSRIHQSFLNIKDCFDSNISGTKNVLEFCLKNKIEIIYSATSANLGNSGKDENLSPYAFTKANNLKLIINLNKWFGLKYKIIYFSILSSEVINASHTRLILLSPIETPVGKLSPCSDIFLELKYPRF